MIYSIHNYTCTATATVQLRNDTTVFSNAAANTLRDSGHDCSQLAVDFCTVGVYKVPIALANISASMKSLSWFQ
jgi:hypothetical protein